MTGVQTCALPISEREEGLVATASRALLGDREHLVGSQVRVLESCGRLGEGAVPALVTTQHRERDEDLGRIGDTSAEGMVTNLLRLDEQLVEG